MSEADLKKLRKKLIDETKEKISESIKEDFLVIRAFSIKEFVERNKNTFDEVKKGFEEALGLMKNKDKVSEKILEEVKKGSNSFLLLEKNLDKYIKEKMKSYPNLSALLGEKLAARFLYTAGSLGKLASLPSSTIQVLGAERLLFLHLKKRTKPPKHGIIFYHPMVSSLPKKQRGKMARSLASLTALASRLDLAGKQLNKKLIEKAEKRYRQLKNQAKR